MRILQRVPKSSENADFAVVSGWKGKYDRIDALLDPGVETRTMKHTTISPPPFFPSPHLYVFGYLRISSQHAG